MSTSNSIILRIENDPLISPKVKRLLSSIYTSLIARSHEGEVISDDASHLFVELIDALHSDAFVSEKSIHDSQIEAIWKQAKLRLDQWKKKWIESSFNVEQLESAFAELTECVESGFKIMASVFQHVSVVISLPNSILV